MLTRWVSSPSLLPCSCAAPGLGVAGVISRLLLAQDELRGDEEDEEKAREHEQVEPKLVEAERLGEGADADRLVTGRRKGQAQYPPDAGQRGYRQQQAGEVNGRGDRQ